MLRTTRLIPVLGVALHLCGIARASDWPQFQAEPSHGGATFAERYSPPLAVRYAVPLNIFGGETVFTSSSAVVVGDTLYVGSTGGAVVAVGRRTGVERWRVQTDGPIRGAPALAADRVIVASMDGTVRGLDPETGAERWRLDAGSPIAAPITVAEVGGEPRVYLAGLDGGILCVRAADGSLVWSRSLGGQACGAVSLNAAGTRAYVGSYDQRVAAFNASDGTPLWTTDPNDILLGAVRATVAVQGTRLYAATLWHGLRTLNDAGSFVQEPWTSVPLTGSHTGSPAVVPTSGLASATVYVVDDAGRLLAVEDRGSQGQIMWTQPLGARAAASAAFADNRVFAGVEDGTLQAFDATDVNGQQVVSLSATQVVDGSPVPAHGLLAVTTAGGDLKVYGNAVDGPERLAVLAVDAGGVHLSWTPVTHPPMETPVSGYRLYRTTAPGGAFTPVAFIPGTRGGVTVTVYTDTSLSASCVYYYALTALDVVPSVTFLAESTYSNVVKAELPPDSVSVALTLTPSPASAGIGEALTYRLVVRNAGLIAVDALAVREVVPLVLLGVTTDQPVLVGSPTVSGSVYTWTGSRLDLSPGGTFTFTITGQLGLVCAPTTLAAQASVAAAGACGTTLVHASAPPLVVGPHALSLSATKTQTPTAPSAGGTLTYRIIVTNSGSATLTSLEVVDTIGIAFTSVSTEQPQGFAPPTATPLTICTKKSFFGNCVQSVTTATRYAWAASGLAMVPGVRYTFTLTATVPSVCSASTFDDRAVVRGSTACATTAFTTNAVSFTLPPPLALSVTKTKSPATPGVGQTVTYRIVVASTGTATMTAFDLVDTVAGGLTSIATSQPAPFQPPVRMSVPGGTRLRWNASNLTLEPGAAMTFTVTGQVALACAPVTIVNRASAGWSTACGPYVNLSFPASFSLGAPSAPSLTVVKTALTVAPYWGGPLTYQIVVTNTGAVTLTSLQVVDTLPTAFSGVASSSAPPGFTFSSQVARRTGSFGLPGAVVGTRALWTGANVTLTPGTSFTFLLVGALGSGCTSGTVSNEAAALGSTGCAQARGVSSAVSSLVTPPVASLSATTFQAPASPTSGSPVTYTIVLGNSGKAVLGTLVLVDTVPSQVAGLTTTQPPSFPPPAMTSVAGGTRVVWTSSSGTLSPGGALSFGVVGTLATGCGAAVVANRAAASGLDGCAVRAYAASNEVSFSATLTSGQPPSVVKSQTPADPALGDAVTYRLVVGNEGGVTLDALRVVDTIASALAVTAASQPPGVAPAVLASVPGGTRYEWGGPSVSLPPGVTLTFTIVGTWSPTGSPGIVRNRAVAAGDAPCGRGAALSNEAVLLPPGGNLLLAADDGFIDLGWTPIAGASALRLYRREGPAGVLVLRRVLPASATTFTDVQVENGVAYRYVLASVDGANIETVQGNSVGTSLTRGWPMFQRDALHDAYDPALDIPPPLGERWRAVVKVSGVEAFPLQTAVIVAGTLFTPPTSDDAQARIAATGATLWTALNTSQGTANTRNTAAVHHGRVYLAHPGGLTVRRADTGAVDWQLQTNPSAGFDQSNPGSPIIYKGVCYAPFFTASDWRVVAIDADPSSASYQTILWESPGLVDRAYGTPAAAAGRVYVVDFEGHLRAYDAATGATLWHQTLGSQVETTEGLSLVASPPVVLATGTDGNLRAFRASDGLLLWTVFTGSRLTSPAMTPEVAILSAQDTNTVEARFLSTGATKWVATTYTTTGVGIMNGAPLIAGPRVHVHATNGQVFTLDLGTGAVQDVASVVPGLEDVRHISGGDGQLYIPTGAGEIIAVTPVTAAPANLSAVAGASDIRLSWMPPAPNIAPIDGYNVYRSTVSGATGVLIGQAAGAGTSMFTDGTSASGVVYFYLVRAVDNRGVEGRSSNPALAGIGGSITVVDTPGLPPDVAAAYLAARPKSSSERSMSSSPK